MTISIALGHLAAGRSRTARVGVAAVLPLLLGSAAPAAPGGVLAAVRPEAALIDKGDLGVATYAMLFVIVALLIDRWMDRRALARLADAIDRASKADSDRSTAMLVQLSVLASAVGRGPGAAGA